MTSALLVVAVVVLVYWFPMRWWFRRWGATEADLSRTMRGDAIVPEPTYVATLAVTVDAPPDRIWPWLVQIGYRRGGLYSYDWLDRLFGYLDRPSADSILPEFQRLKEGDEIAMGRGPGFPVRVVEPRQALVLGGEAEGFVWVWQFGLYPLAQNRTRLVSRNSARLPRSAGAWLMMRVLEPAAFVMTRKMLIGLKRRAEARDAIESGPSASAA